MFVPKTYSFTAEFYEEGKFNLVNWWMEESNWQEGAVTINISVSWSSCRHCTCKAVKLIICNSAYKNEIKVHLNEAIVLNIIKPLSFLESNVMPSNLPSV